MNPYCEHIRSHFSGYLDGAITGTEMSAVAAHLQGCQLCFEEFGAWRGMQEALYTLGPAKAPDDMALRLRVAISQERAKTAARSLERLQVRWENTFAPFLLRAAAGMASTFVLVGTLAFLVGLVAAPAPLAADDEPLPGFTSPHFLYSAVGPAGIATGANGVGAGLSSAGIDQAVVVEAYVNAEGRIYDYRIVSGPADAQTRAKLESLLVFSVFQPALDFGEPVRGRVILSFGWISVQG